MQDEQADVGQLLELLGQADESLERGLGQPHPAGQRRTGCCRGGEGEDALGEPVERLVQLGQRP